MHKPRKTISFSIINILFVYPIIRFHCIRKNKVEFEIWKFFSKYDKNGAVGIDEIQTYELLDISPNPVIDLLNIVSEYASNEPYEIVSALGKTVMNGVWKTGMTKINVAHLNPGSYIFRLGTKQARFIIQ